MPFRPIHYLTPEQIRRLVESSRDDPFGPLFAFALYTGLRLGEILGLAWDDIAGDSLQIRRTLARADGGGWEFAEPKSARSRRTITLPALAIEALEEQRERQADPAVELVFADPLGRPVSGRAVSKAWTAAVQAAGLPPTRFHDARHSWATTALAAGVPLSTIADHLGHSTIAITHAYYAAVTPKLHRDAAAAIDRVLG
jgi:integrase